LRRIRTIGIGGRYLIVEFANELRRTGLSKREAVERAAGIRLRPILMTTAAMVLGVIPLITASGAGAVSRFNGPRDRQRAFDRHAVRGAGGLCDVRDRPRRTGRARRGADGAVNHRTA
jgi:hypothetical protein